MVGEHGRALLVEDNSNDVELTLEALDELQLAINIDVVRDGEEALEYLYRRGEFTNRLGDDPLVIFIDIKLPKVTGLEVLKQIRSDEKLKRIPVVIFSSSRERKDLIEAYASGVNAYVVKPVESRGFFEAVKASGLFWMEFNEPPPFNTE
jgi:CheY-like chemotaxis protein